MADLDQTTWRRLTVVHPREWEVAVASGPHDKRRLVLADRYHQRVDIRWRVDLAYEPQLDRVMDRYRQEDGAAVEFQIDSDAPKPWSVIVHPLKTGCLVYGGRLFPEVRAMVEVRVLWPGRRDVNLERAVLESIALAGGSGRQTWRALGLHVDVSGEYDMVNAELLPGRLAWQFECPRKSEPLIRVERIGMVDHWLTGPLGDWLVEQLPGEYRCDQQEVRTVGPHRGQRLLSSTRAGILDMLRGRRHERLDHAWKCDLQQRVYHVTVEQSGATTQARWPEHLTVRCCQEVDG